MAGDWLLRKVRVCNWGGFDNKVHDISLGNVNVICGATGCGKTSLIDAIQSVLVPEGVHSYNAASGTSDRRDMTRSTASYVRGGYDNRKDDDGYDRPVYLRGKDSPVLSSVVLVFESALGETVSGAAFRYMEPGSTKLKRSVYVIAEGELDPRVAYSTGGLQGSASDFKRAYPHAVLVTDRQHDFHSEFWDKVGMGSTYESGLLTAQLMVKLLSCRTDTNIDTLFKTLVADKSVALERGQKVVGCWDTSSRIVRESSENKQRYDALKRVKEHYDEYISSRRKRDELNDLLGKDGSTLNRLRFGLRKREASVLEILEQERAGDVERYQKDLEAATADTKACEVEYNRLDALARDAGAADIDRLEEERVRLEGLVAEKKRTRDRLKNLLDHLGQTLPNSEAEWMEELEAIGRMLREVEGEVDELDVKRVDAQFAVKEAEKRLKEAEKNLEYFSNRRVRLPLEMDRMRGQLADVVGMDPSELPFLAELVDVQEDEVRWLRAVDVALRPISNVILVDASREREFREKIDKGARGLPRFNFECVDLEKSYDFHPVEGCVSSKLKWNDDSPFCGWVKDRICGKNVDMVPVETAVELAFHDKAVTLLGQTKTGRRGAHGKYRNDAAIIGFMSERELEEREEECARLNDRVVAARDTLSAVTDSFSRCQEIIQASKGCMECEWEKIDVFSVNSSLESVCNQLGALRSDDKVSLLREQRDAARKRLDTTQKARWRVEDELAKVTSELASVKADIQRGVEDFDRLAGEGIDAISPEQDVLVGEALAGSSLGISGFAGIYDRISSNLRDQRNVVAKKVDDEQDAVREGLKNYRDLYDPYGTDYGCNVVDWESHFSSEYENLAGAMKDIREARRTCVIETAQAVASMRGAYEDDLNFIRGTLEDVNEILATSPFGSHRGILRLAATRRRTAEQEEYHEMLRRNAAYAVRFSELEAAEDAIWKARYEDLGHLVDKIRNGIKYGPNELRKNNVVDGRSQYVIKSEVEWETPEGKETSVYSSSQGRSGGESQELMAGVICACLLCRTGKDSEGILRPAFSAVFLDEAFEKADEEATYRGLCKFRDLGFQLVLVVANSKFEDVSSLVGTRAIVLAKNDDTHKVTVSKAELIEGGR